MLPFAPGIAGYCTEQDDKLSLELRSLRNLHTTTFVTQNSTVINTVKSGFSPILEDYLGDSLPGFSDAFFKMIEYPIPVGGEEREFEIFDGVKMKFCWVPVGEAQLGSPEEELNYLTNTLYEGERPEWLRNESEIVRGKYKSNGFWMGKYPVIQSQWETVMGENPSHFKGGNLPVEQITWNDCQKFIQKCSVLGLKLQLPHEDQWEYACRGGKGNKQPFYWGDTLNGDKANSNGNYPYGTNEKGVSLEKTTEVGSYEKVAPHPWGLCDMHGNVYEWCNNLHSIKNLDRVIRGGCWFSYPWVGRSSNRSFNIMEHPQCGLGFRLIVC